MPSQAARLLVLALVLCVSATAAQEVYFGKIQEVAVHGRDRSSSRGGGPGGGSGGGGASSSGADGGSSSSTGQGKARLVVHEHHINLMTKSGELKRLLFPVELDKMPRSGSMVMVRSQEMSKCTQEPQRPGTICVASMMAHEASPKDIFAKGQKRGKVHMKALVIQLDVCNWGIAQKDWDALEGAVWSGLPRSQNVTVESMMQGCSFGMGSITMADGGHLLRVPVPIPCNGTTPDGTLYNSLECPFPEWSDVANDWLKKNRPDIRLKDWPHKIYLVPKGDTCGWGGMGFVGCDADCRVWINGDLWNEPDTYFHELGHNLYLNHAGKWGNDGYDDMSGAMGYCCDIRCHNAPHAHQVGWAAPVATLSSENFPAGTWLTFSLPAAALDPKNFVRIWPDWDAKGSKSRLYLQYKKRIGFDYGIDKVGSFGDRVIVYSAAAADPQPFTSWEAGIDAGQQWRETRLNSSVIIRVPSYDAATNTATIRVCHWTEKTESSCDDGLDNDCDGRTDTEDVDCQAARQQEAAPAAPARIEAAPAAAPLRSPFDWFG